MNREFDPEAWLGSLDAVGWRFGLDRIEALLAALGDPQHAVESIHVVGTNGKSSVATMTAAVVEAAGRSAGCYLSPHSERWAQRIRIRGREIPGGEFAAAAARVAGALPGVEADLEPGDRITQFEAATAVAFTALEAAGVEVGVIEAGLGGRLDATNVLRSRAVVLTSIGLDHTEWLGDSELEIAREKLAVIHPGSALVLGTVSGEVRELALRTATARGCRVVEPGPPPDSGGAPYLRRNLALALAAAGVLGAAPGADELEMALASLELPGRFEVIGDDPPLVLDAAHNPAGARALAEALGERFGSRPVVGCIAILADKDAEAIIAELAPVLSSSVCTEIPPERLTGAGRPGTASVPAAELVRLSEAAGVPASANANPTDAVARAAALARERDGVALLVGSHYLLSYGWIPRHDQSSSR